MLRWSVLPVFAASLLFGCGDESCPGECGPQAGCTPCAADAAEPPDSGPGDAGIWPDAEPPDSGPPDLGVADVGFALQQSSCYDCQTGCPGGLCVTAGTAQFCVDSCDDPASRESCLAGYSCVDINPDAPELFICAPPSAICDQPGINFGTPCSGGVALCVFDRTHCQGDLLSMGYCTDFCAGDTSCPPAYFCGPGDDGTAVCLARFAPPSERCGREGEVREATCAWDGDCAAGACAPAWPGLPGVCAPECGGGCGEGSVCRDLGGGRGGCLTERCACRGSHLPPEAPPGRRDLFAEALEAVELDRCRAIFGVSEMIAAPQDLLWDPYRLSFYHQVQPELWRVPPWSRATVGGLDQAAGAAEGIALRASRMIAAQAELADRPAVRRVRAAPDPIAPLTEATALFIEAAGGVPDRPAIALDAADVPLPLQLAMATVIEGARQALLARQAALAALSAQQIQQLYDYGPAFVARRADGFGLSPAGAAGVQLFNVSIRYGELAGGAADLLEAIDAADLERFLVPAGTATVATATAALLFSQLTPAGRIAIGDGQNGIYDPRIAELGGDWAVLLDLGGHDDYRIAAGGNTSAANPVSVAIDLGGADRYQYLEVPHPLDGARLPSDQGGRFTPASPQDGGPVSLSETPRQGGARVGIAAQIDLGTDPDRYRSLRISQGAGVFGAGVLLDAGGDDDYAAETVAQGSAAFGVGLLLDDGGADRYRAYQMAQGFGFARGVGLAYDRGGDDRWSLDVGDPAVGGDPLYPSAQRPASSNASLGQGFGFGRRADFSDRAFMSGGVGLLIDAGGDDEYEASVFAQGGGFWFGTGVLADHGGDDVYDGMWYAMASGAHYALGVLLDGAGNDTYGGRLPRLNVTIAGGHDFSVAALIDESGDDTYFGSRITLGSGNATGMGLFVDNAGNDRYASLTGYSMGGAGLRDPELAAPGSARRKIDTIGVFIDAGGSDQYSNADLAPPDAKDDAAWTRGETPQDPAIRANERGTGVDGDGESTIHARWP